MNFNETNSRNTFSGVNCANVSTRKFYVVLEELCVEKIVDTAEEIGDRKNNEKLDRSDGSLLGGNNAASGVVAVLRNLKLKRGDFRAVIPSSNNFFFIGQFVGN